jgi:hypothetical protein
MQEYSFLCRVLSALVIDRKQRLEKKVKHLNVSAEISVLKSRACFVYDANECFMKIFSTEKILTSPSIVEVIAHRIIMCTMYIYTRIRLLQCKKWLGRNPK